MTRSLLVLALFGCNKDDDTDAGPWDPRFDALAESAETELAESTAPALSIAIMEGGEITFAHAFGSKHPDEDVEVTAETLFMIGSITKQMTAVTVLQKVEAGTLALDDTLVETIPELVFESDPALSAEITLHQQLSHQSGLYDQIPWTLTDTADETLATYTTTTFAQTEYQMNPAGLFWNYSNPNFSLAGLAVEGVDDRAWPDVIAEDVFAPLGMERTFSRKADVEADGDFAVGHGYRTRANGAFIMGTVELENVSDYAWIRPAGLVWSTPSDLLVWADFVMHGDAEVLSDTLRAQLTTPHVAYSYGPGAADPSYGYGVTVSPGFFVGDLDTYYDVPMWDHGGNTLSFSSGLYMLPESDVAIAWIASGYAVSFPDTVGLALEEYGDLPGPVDDPPRDTSDPTRLDDHVGTYVDPNNVGTMVVTREGDELHVAMPNLVAFGYDVEPVLERISDTLFYLYLNDAPYDVTFFGEPGQPSTYVRNRAFVLEREAPPVSR